MNYFKEQEQNAFKPVKKNPIILDFSGCKYPAQIHTILKEAFGLPEYYGENWDALWDCLDGRFDEKDDILVEICGFSDLKKPLRDYCEGMLKVFEDIHTETPTMAFNLLS